MSETVTSTTTLRTALGRHRIGDLLRDGTVVDPAVELDLVDVEPIHRAFAPMVRDQAYDVSELAIVTALQAVAYGHPVGLLPIVVAARFQRKCLIAHRDRPIVDPRELRGKRIGVRSYTQTTGLWVRTHLQDDYGVRAEESTWITQNPAHVPEYEEPPFVHRTLDRSLVDALRDGEIDAAILGNDLPAGDEFVPVIDHPENRDRDWYVEHGYMPINHLVSVSLDTLQRDPGAVRAAWGMLSRAEELAAAETTSPRPTMAGLDRVRGPVEEIAASSLAQGMLPRALTTDELFGPFEHLIA